MGVLGDRRAIRGGEKWQVVCGASCRPAIGEEPPKAVELLHDGVVGARGQGCGNAATPVRTRYTTRLRVRLGRWEEPLHHGVPLGVDLEEDQLGPGRRELYLAS